MNESAYYRKFRTRLTKEGARVIKIHGSGYGQVGVSDVLVVHPGWHGWIEFKVGRRKLTPTQVAFTQDMRRKGMHALVVRGPEHSVETCDGKHFTDLDWSQPLIPQLHDAAVLIGRFDR